jgi:hypothetical protein
MTNESNLIIENLAILGELLRLKYDSGRSEGWFYRRTITGVDQPCGDSASTSAMLNEPRAGQAIPALMSTECLDQGKSSGQRVLFDQFVEQCLGVFQIGGVEAFGEPAIDVGEHCAGFSAATLLLEQPGEAHRRAQLP